MPPLIPSQVRTNLKKPGQKVLQQRPLVTLSHVHSSAELKSFPVRPAHYATNYVFVRTAHIVPSFPGGDAAAASSVGGAVTSSVPSSPTASSCVQSVNSPASDSSVITAASAVKLPIGTPILLPFPQVEQLSQSSPAVSLTLSSIDETNHPTKLVPSRKMQPVFRLPFPVSSINSNLIVKAVPHEGSNMNKVKENLCVDAPNSHSVSYTNLADNETVLSSDGVLKQQHILSPSSSSKSAICSIKHSLVPVSTPASEFALLASFPSPVIVTAKLIPASSLTVDSKPLTVSTKSAHFCTQTVTSPQAGPMSSAPNSAACPSPVQPVLASPSNTKSPGLVMSPSLAHATESSSLQTCDAPRFNSSVILAHLVRPINKQQIATQARSVRLTSSQLRSTTPLNHSVTSKEQAPANKTSSSNSSSARKDETAGDHCMDVPDSKQSPSTSVRENKVTSLVLSSTPTAGELHLTRSNPASISSSNVSKYLTAAKKSVKREKKGHRLKKFSRTFHPRPSSLIPVSLKSSECIDSEVRIAMVTTAALPNTSSVTSSSILVCREANTIFTPSFHPRPGTPKSASFENVSPTSLCMSTIESESQQQHAYAVNMATPSAQPLPLTVLAAPQKFQHFQKPCMYYSHYNIYDMFHL